MQEARDLLQHLQQEASARVMMPSPAVAPDVSPEVARVQDTGKCSDGGHAAMAGAGENNEARTGPSEQFRVPDSGGSHRVDGCSPIRSTWGMLPKSAGWQLWQRERHS